MSGQGHITQLCSIPEGEPAKWSLLWLVRTVWRCLDHPILRSSVYLSGRKTQNVPLSKPRLAYWVVDIITMAYRWVRYPAPTISIFSSIFYAISPVSLSGISKHLPVSFMVCRFLMTVTFLCFPVVPRNYFLVLTLACFLVFGYRLGLSVSSFLCYRLHLKLILEDNGL